MKSKKILIITLIIILVLAVAGTVFAYLFIATDTFKGDKELFAKYISQNSETLEKFTDLQTKKVYEGLKDEEKYESDTEIKATYSEGGEVSNPINNLSAKINIQKDNTEDYFYADGQISYGNEKYLEAEAIKDQEAYGVRFTDIVKQFVTVKNDSKLGEVAKDLGTDSVTLEKIMDVIDGKENATEEIVSKEDVQKIKDKYMNIITNAVSNGTFSSNKDAKITYNNNTVSAKAYTVSLTSEQVEGMIVEILNNLKEEDKIGEKYQDKINDIISNITDEKEIPAVKITVYEQNKKTIRTAIEITSLAKITVENTDENNELKTKIQISGISTETTEEYNIEITKKTDENQENVEAVLSVTNGDDTYQTGISNTLKNSDSEIQIKTIFEYKKDILTAALNLNNNIILGDSFEKKQTLANNNYVLNDAPAESRQKVITQLKQVVPEKMTTRMGLLMEAIGLKQNNVTETEKPESEMTQVDINKFNAKFEFFTGDEVTPENVKTLIGIAKENLGSYEINIVEDSQNSGNTTTTDPEKIKYSIKLKIEKGKTNEDGTNQILAKISDKKKYKVSIFYKEQNNMIDYITIDEAAK
ncbi:unknown [Clostridium sp. CAG:356]|nr:unknown [Clostridium sp. CAG:356]